jgi:hypothetical protein
VAIETKSITLTGKHFAPHGIASYTDTNTGVTTVFIVNHGNPEQDAIEQFVQARGTRMPLA